MALLAIGAAILFAGATGYLAFRPSSPSGPAYVTVFSGRLVSNNSTQPSRCETCFTQANQTVNVSAPGSAQSELLYLSVIIQGPDCTVGFGQFPCRYLVYVTAPGAGPIGDPGYVLDGSTIVLGNNSWSGFAIASSSATELTFRLSPGTSTFYVELTVKTVEL